MTERQAKDGTFYKQVGPDDWAPVTRKAKDGTVYKKVGQDEWSPVEAPTPQGASASDKGRAALEGFADSSSFGLLPYMKAAGEVATDWAAEKILGSDADNTPFDQRVQKFRDQGKSLQDKAPGYAMGGQLAGFIAPGVGASKLVGRGLQAASRVSGATGRAAQAVSQSGKARELYKAAEAAKAAGDTTRAAQLVRAARADLALQGVKIGTEGAILGAAYTPESGFSDVGARLENTVMGFGTGAIVPPALRAGGNVIRGTGSTLASGGKKILSTLGGVSEDVIERYLQNPERVRNASTFDELYEQVSGIVRGLADDLDNSKIDYDSAKAHLDEVSRGIRESRVEGKAAALEEVQRARAQLDEAFKQRKAVITERASPSRIEPAVEDALRNQKSRVVQGSKESFDILDKAEGAVDLAKVFKLLRPIKKSLDVAGKGPATPQAAAAQKEIDNLMQYIGILPGRLPHREAKKLIQQIDKAEKVIYDSGAFTDEVSNAFRTIRGGVDEQLKQIGPYAEKMTQVADDTRIYGAARELFGKDTSRLSRLSNLGRATARTDREALERLAAREGGELLGDVNRMVDAQRTLKSPTRMESVRASLPENQAVRSAEMQAATTKRMAKPKAIREAIDRSAAFYKARSAKANHETAKKLANQFKSFGEQSAESKLKQVAQGRKYATKQLEELSKLSDTDFVEAAKAASDAAAFTKTAFHGSRNVNMWGILMMAGARGAAGGLMAGPAGAAAGVVIGSMMDIYGPRMTKKILDGVIKIKGPLNESAIRKLDLPENVKTDLISQFRSTVLAERAASRAGESAIPRVADHELDRDSATPSQYRRSQER